MHGILTGEVASYAALVTTTGTFSLIDHKNEFADLKFNINGRNTVDNLINILTNPLVASAFIGLSFGATLEVGMWAAAKHCESLGRTGIKETISKMVAGSVVGTAGAGLVHYTFFSVINHKNDTKSELLELITIPLAATMAAGMLAFGVGSVALSAIRYFI